MLIHMYIYIYIDFLATKYSTNVYIHDLNMGWFPSKVNLHISNMLHGQQLDFNSTTNPTCAEWKESMLVYSLIVS